MKQNNPIHEHKGKWWFWDESWFHRYGPFESKEHAQDAFMVYCNYLDKQGWDNKQKSLQKPNIDWEFVILVMVLAIFLSTVVYLLT